MAYPRLFKRSVSLLSFLLVLGSFGQLRASDERGDFLKAKRAFEAEAAPIPLPELRKIFQGDRGNPVHCSGVVKLYTGDFREFRSGANISATSLDPVRGDQWTIVPPFPDPGISFKRFNLVPMSDGGIGWSGGGRVLVNGRPGPQYTMSGALRRFPTGELIIHSTLFQPDVAPAEMYCWEVH